MDERATAANLARRERAIVLHHQGKIADAEQLYLEILRHDPSDFDALHLLGLIAIHAGRTEQGVTLITKAIVVNPTSAPAYNNLGCGLANLSLFEEALVNCDQAIAIQPDFADAHGNRGWVLLELKRFEEALASCDQAIAFQPNFANAHSNRGWALSELKRFEEALASCDRAIALQPDFAGAHSNRGWALLGLRRLEEAIASCDQAIALKPDFAQARSNRGYALFAQKRFEEALASFDQAIALKPSDAQAHNDRGWALFELKRIEEATASFARAIALKPDSDFFLGAFLHSKIRMCDWSDYDSILVGLRECIRNGERAIPPFDLLALPSSPDLQRKASEIWTSAKCRDGGAKGEISKLPAHQRMRIGYFSADFRYHATAFLMAELFERHDRSRFEIIGFSFGPDTGDDIRQRVKAAFDRFIDVQRMSDPSVTKLARSLEIDIAVDLNGFTKGARTNVFAMRAAPIQVSYLGYPGTMGANYIDYLIADSCVIPTSHQCYYAEKIAYLPNSYQPNDRKRQISDTIFTRSQLALPQNGFVYCCFNDNYKIAPNVFDSWMRILGRVEGSVLWLFKNNEITVRNLRTEASVRGVDPDRLVFALVMPLPDHLARHRAADLFLDTLPCNAHTTASDSLWAGLPVLTQIGETFAGRVAASLLNAVNVPELITTTREDYEALAIELGTNPAKLASIKQKLAFNRLSTPLFDSELFTKHIEAAYTTMYERYQANLPTDDIYVPN